MPVEDDHFFTVSCRDFFQSLAQLQFFRRKNFRVETTEFAERRGLNKNEGARQPFLEPAREVPALRDEIGGEVAFVQPHRGTSGDDVAGMDGFGHVGKQFRARMRIGIHKDEPIAACCGCTGITGSPDLVERFEDNLRASAAGNFRSAVSGIVVAHDEFKLPATLLERGRRRLHFGERDIEKLFLVEGRDDDRNFHIGSLAVGARF